MTRTLAFLAFLSSAAAFAQSAHDHAGMHGAGTMAHEQTLQGHRSQAGLPTQPGQSAFAAIQEIVGILNADPNTDWSKVDIDALRQHLIDMNNVTLLADARSEPIDGGMRFIITGAGPVRDSIRRMVTAHAATMNGVDGWTFEAAEIEDGAALTVHTPAKDTAKLRGLGFLGVLARGMHHQEHHLMIARGENPHH